MLFMFTPAKLINMLIIAIGIGVCGLSFMQITTSTNIAREVKRFFQLFFILIIVYIGTHLARELMDGHAGTGVRIALQTVTFIEILSAGFMSLFLSMLVYAVSKTERYKKQLQITLISLIVFHIAVLVIGLFTGLVYRFDESNVYMRGKGYLLSNLAPLVMLLINSLYLIRYKNNINPRLRKAFWIYLISPIAAIAIQSFFYGIQFIILATVASAVYMFQVIVKIQSERYEKQQMETSRLETELTMATRIQADMLPNIFPAFPDRKEFDIYATMTPAKEVGGDFYDYFFIDDDHLGLVMADVSGKGVPAALFMMASKILIQNYAMMKGNPREALEAANRQICQNNREDMFVTIWLGILDVNTGLLMASNAGHEYPVVKNPGGEYDFIKDKHGLAVGAYVTSKYMEYEIQLEKGSMVFIYTDGVVEATDANEQLFGNDRLLDALNGSAEDTPESALDSVSKAVKKFVKGAPQFDDLTMLCLKFNGK